MAQVAVLGNFSNNFLMDAVQKKVFVKTGAGLTVQADGTITADIPSATTNDLTGAGTTLTSTVDGQAASIDITPLVQAAETTTNLGYDAPSTTLTYTNEDGTVQSIDLSALTTDIFVNGGSYDPATGVLVLQDNDATTPDITLDLSTLKAIETANSASISLAGDGVTGTELTATLLIGTDAGNLLKQVTGGVGVLPGDVRALADVEVQDLFGDPISLYGFSTNS